ncbi:hypothetical protein [Salinibius halmophilus]|uniref:hypothetical protein n=1 Tax=Salinibius halmophilus TaxID=1853216 RepID=UPI0013143FCC|nr:hypothetical protein [Salinibius halmophilus]
MPLIHITKVETKSKKGEIVEAIVHTGKDSFQMMELERFAQEEVEAMLTALNHIARQHD